MELKKNLVWGMSIVVGIGIIAVSMVLFRRSHSREDARPPLQPPHRPTSETIHTTDRPSGSTPEPLPPSAVPHTPSAMPTLPGKDAPPETPGTLPSESTDRSQETPVTKGPLTHPPGFSEPEIPMTETAQLLDLVRKTMADAGPQSAQVGRDLLNADDPKMRQLGAIILAEQAGLDTAILERVATDASPTVPLNTLGWILDSGGQDQADQLIGLLVGRGLQTDSLMGLLAGDELSESGSRAALDLLNASLDTAAKSDVFGTISEDDAYAYSVRMKATTLLRDTMAFEDYRNYVQTAEQNSGSQDALWQEGIERLSDSLDGPAQIHEGPAILTPSDIDEMLAREYPMILEDLAQRLEYVLSKEDAYIQPGTAERLASRVEELKNRPWASTQQISLRRLESALKLLPEAEDTNTPPPPNYLPPPPGL